MNTDPIVIVSAARTPMGAFQGELKGFAAPELGAAQHIEIPNAEAIRSQRTKDFRPVTTPNRSP